MYEVLNLHTQLDLQSSKFEVKEKIKSSFKDHMLDKLIKILDVSTNLSNFIDLVECIDRNLYKCGYICQ